MYPKQLDSKINTRTQKLNPFYRVYRTTMPKKTKKKRES